MKLFLDVIQFLHYLMQPLPHIENIYHLYFFGFVAFFFFILSLESAYDLLHLKLIQWHLKIQRLKWIKYKINFCHWCFWIALTSWKKCFEKFINNITLQEIINSILLLFKCITCSSSASFKEIKLIAIVNWIFSMYQI